jgi:hypothetical protein
MSRLPASNGQPGDFRIYLFVVTLFILKHEGLARGLSKRGAPLSRYL